MKRRRFLLALALFLVLALAAIAATGASSQTLSPDTADVLAQPQPSALVDAIRQGKWPAQVAAHSGSIRPDRHGPQRNDPAEGIPTHAYSPFDERSNREYPCPPGGCEFQKGRVLVKLAPQVKPRRLDEKGAWTEDDRLNEALQAQSITRLEPIFPRARPPKLGEFIVSALGERLPRPDLSRWYSAELQDEDAADVRAIAQALSETPGIAWAEPDYLRRPAEEQRSGGAWVRRSMGAREPESTSAPLHPGTLAQFTDPLYAQQWHLDATNVPAAWAYLEGEGLAPGGDRDIVVAVIDTGVDYTHPDLAANMWVNAPEFGGTPGVDDDGNGYVDDVYGADTVYPDGDPIDDHGHGTHVAGIVAAQANNGEGGVGVAYNVQVMALKAAQYSGVLAASDIAEAIYYAVEKGADVINMSFGGYARSQVEEDALVVAFGQAVLVAAAGNDRLLNLPCPPPARDMYPAAYNWVLGVMASTSGGSRASFSNFDCIAHDSHEYELLAPGVDVWSTLPNENYAAWDGTSMATPIVSGIAALARTKWSDKDVYSSRFIMGQIASNASPVADAHAALTVAPQPELSYLEHWLFDTEEQSPDNDDDGIVDAGETVDLAIVIRNHWGKADPVTVTLEAWAEGAVFPDPYVTMITDTVNYGAVGSFNWDDNGLIYNDEGVITGVCHPFRFTVPITTPNNHVIPFWLTMTAGNGFDPSDPNAPYTFQSDFSLTVQRGTEVYGAITTDATWTADRLYLVTANTLVGEGVTLTIEPGTEIRFAPGTFLRVDGTLLARGSQSDRITFTSNDPSPEPGDWQGIMLYGPNSEVRFARIYYAENGIAVQSAAATIEHSEFAYNNRYIGHGGIELYQAEGTVIAHNHSHHNGGMGIYMGTVHTDLVIRENLLVFNGEQPGGTTGGIRVGGSIEVYSNTIAFNNPGKSYCASACGGVVFTSGPVPIVSGNNVFGDGVWDAYMELWAAGDVTATHNWWGTADTSEIDGNIHDFNDTFDRGKLTYQPLLVGPSPSAPPVLSAVKLAPTSPVGVGILTVTVDFSGPMTTTVEPSVSFGPDEPYTDHQIRNGQWISPTRWLGSYEVTPATGDGIHVFRVANARSTDGFFPAPCYGRFRFEIITSGTEAMNLQATGGEGVVDLMWTQDDFDLLAGFNLYRATSQDGSYTRINGSIIPPYVRAYQDTDVTPGQPYYYKFTIVKSDMTESDFSNVATATPIDTIPPVISHSPLTEAPPGLPLTIFADVTDNVGVQGVTLHYRAMGETIYSSEVMVHTTGNRYSATLEGSLVTSPGLEYYIEAYDGISTVREGNPGFPYQILVEDRPVVTNVSPDHGPTEGGTLVTISGSNFQTGASVTFGGAVAGDVTLLSSNQITCTTPPHFPETVDVIVTNPDDKSGTLLRGFTYQSAAAQLSLPDTGGEQHAIVQAPVNAANVQGLAAASLTISFDAGVLSAQSASTGNLTPGWSLAANTDTPGEIRLSMASSGGTVSGSGVLATIEFEAVGSPGTNSTLHFASVLLNDGAIPAETTDGSFAVNLVYDVSGAIGFWNGGAGVPGALLTLEGDRVYTGLSQTDGTYTVSGAPAGDYTLTPSKSDDVNGISAYDGSLVLQHDAGLITLSGYAATAADVNKSGAITSMDAYYILQKAVDLITLPFPGAGVVWDFDPASRSYIGLSSDQAGQDFTAVLLGDTSGNWSATGGQSLTAVANGSVVVRVRGSVPDASGTVTATVMVEPGVAPIYSLDLVLRYDPGAATALAVEPGPMAEGWLVNGNLERQGEVLVALAGALPVTEAGPMVTLHFRLSDPAQSTSLQPSWGEVNEGTVPAYLIGGRLGFLRLYQPLILSSAGR